MNKTTSRVVFLDFDGVLFDTVREAYAVTMIALRRFVQVVDVDFDSKHFAKFSQFRYLTGPAWNYYYLIQSIDKKIAHSAVDLEAEYKKLLEPPTRGEHRSFEENFFQSRKRIRETDHDCWLSLISPYNIFEDMRELINEFRSRFFLVTTRDRESVLDLLNLYNLYIPEPNVCAKKEYALHGSKLNVIQDLINKHKINESLFIDDLEEHLMACGTIENLLAMQAKWGYVVPHAMRCSSKSSINNDSLILCLLIKS
jgi:phosphoglycolate phosphatase-like HAD superfamily hydrolase